MTTTRIWDNSLQPRQLADLAAQLRQGRLLIIPTDTIYAICCDALNRKAIEALCRLKGINPDKTNLSIICSGIPMAAEYARFDNRTFQLIRQNTPGPVTFLCRAASSLPAEFKRRKTVGIRIPDCPAPRQLAEELGNPLLTTTIEFADSDYATNPELIAEAYEGRADIILLGEEGGEIPSTVIDCTGPEPIIVREGEVVPEI